MSRELEAGRNAEESIPLVVFDQGRHSNDHDGEDRAVARSKKTTFLHTQSEGGKEVNLKHLIKSDILGHADYHADENLKVRYKIDLCEGGCEGAFNVMKVKAKAEAADIARDAAKCVELFSIELEAFEAIICIDDEDSLSDSGAELLNKLMQETSGSILLLANGLPENISPDNHIDKIASVIQTSVVSGDAVSNSVYDTKYCGVIDHTKRKNRYSLGLHGEGLTNHIINCVLLLDGASKYDIVKYKLAILRQIQERCPYCVKVILNGSRELLLSLSNGVYFEDSAGILLPKNSGYLSPWLYAFVEACRAESKLPYLAQIDLILAFQKYLSDSDQIDVDCIFENLKQNMIKFHLFDELEDTMDNVIGNAIAKSLNMRINFLTDTSEAVLERFCDKNYFVDNITTIIFKGCGGFPSLLANYVKDGVYQREYSKQTEHFMKVIEMCDDESFIKNINNNISKLKVYDADNPNLDPANLVSTVQDSLGRWALDDYILQMGGTVEFEDFTRIDIMTALRYNRPDVFKRWYHMQVEIDTYIFCNLRFHWHDLDKRGESQVADMLKILPYDRREQRGRQSFGKTLNNAFGVLSNGIIADCFDEDGHPNVGIISPIQALIMNRVICMQFDFVKVLWELDKQNIMVNTVMIWILIHGISARRIFSRESGTAELAKAKDYFAKAIQRLLDQLLIMFPDTHFAILKCRVALFRGKSLYQLAGDGEFFRFLCHTVTKRCISAEWNNVSNHELKLQYLEELQDRDGSRKSRTVFLRKPRVKLYVHMSMHLITYAMLAYYTLQPKRQSSNTLQWMLFSVISSLFFDEIRQALGEKQYSIRSSLKRWWSDGWNKLDLLSMIIYYIAFCLERSGVVQTSRLFFSTFTFIWCLKFYQFLRAFESLGTYIILVQKMLLHLKNFIIVASIAIVSYGVFMTSLLFPDVNFGSWTAFVMVILRPYLLFFAETGIEEFDISNKHTIYLTPKVGRGPEILTILGMCVFLMFSGVLLLNLLIAIFGGVYEDVKAQSERLWALNDLQLLQEFMCKPTIPVPFSLPISVFLILRRLFSKKTIYLIAENENELALKVYQHDIADQLHEQHVTPSCDTLIHELGMQMSGFSDKIESMRQNLTSSMNDQHEEVTEEIQRAIRDIKRETSAGSRKIEEDIQTELQVFQENIEKKMTEAIRRRNVETDHRIKSIEDKCQEISSLLKELIQNAKTI